MNILSLFDGMSCGQLALERASIKVNGYFASEIDKYAIAVTQFNFPRTVQLGDITKWEDWCLPEIDLIIGGSPCQGFSHAGKGLNFDDPRSKLFFDFVDILNALKPKYFLLENVRMKKEWVDIISKLVDIEPIMINSALVSAQSRERLYWTNIPNVSLPEDMHVYLEDILEYGHVDREKSYCIDANHFKGGNWKSYFEKSRRQLVFNKPIRIAQIGKGRQGERIYGIKGKSVALSALGGGRGAKTGLYGFTYNGKDGFTKPLIKAHTLQASDYKSGSKLNRNQNQTAIINIENFTYRKLTPIECERLQIVPDGYTALGNFNGEIKKISNTQRYKMLGNGFTVEVIAHILKDIKNK